MPGPGVYAATWRPRLVVAIHASWVLGRRPALSTIAARSAKRSPRFVDRRGDVDRPRHLQTSVNANPNGSEAASVWRA
jgi:hypothetical protein